MATIQPNEAPTRPKAQKSDDSAEATLVKNCQKQLKAGGQYFENNFVKKADRLANMYEINHYYDETQGKQLKSQRDRIKVAYPYAYARQILAEIFNGLPEPIVKTENKIQQPKQPPPPPAAPGQPPVQPPPPIPPIDPTEGAVTLKQSIQYIARRSNMEEAVKMMTLDGIVTGFGCVGISAQVKTKIPKYTRFLYREIQADWANITNVYDSDWIACKLVRPLADIKADPIYSENKANVQAAKLDPKIYGQSDIEYGVLWVWHNKKTDQYLIFPDDQSFTLVNKKLSEMYDFKVVSDDFVTDWPFTFFMCEDMVLKPWGLGNLFPFESQVRELDKTRTQQINHRKRFNRKYGYTDGTLDAEGINQLKNPEDGTLVKFKNAITPANFQVLTDAPMTADIYNVDKIIQEDIQVISPLSANAILSGIGKQPDTLGQTQSIQQNSATRLGLEQRQLGNSIARLYKMTAQFIQQYWKEEDVMLVNGEGKNDEDWMHFDPTKVQGEYSYDVEPETMSDNQDLYRSQLQEAIQVTSPLLRIASVSPGIAIMLRKFLQTFDTLKNDIDDIVPLQFAYPNAEEGGLTPIPTERMTFQIALKDYPVPVQIKGLRLAGIDAELTDFPSVDPTTGQPTGGTMPGTAQPTGNAPVQGNMQPDLQKLLLTQDPQALENAINQLPDQEKQAILQHLGLAQPQPTITG